MRRIIPWSVMCLAIGGLNVGLSFGAGGERRAVQFGEAALHVDSAGLDPLGVAVFEVARGLIGADSAKVSMTIVDTSLVEVVAGPGNTIVDGALHTTAGLAVVFGKTTVVIEQAVIRPFVSPSGSRLVIVDGQRADQSPLLDLDGAKASFNGEFLSWETASVTIAAVLARELGNPALEGVNVGYMTGKAFFAGQEPVAGEYGEGASIEEAFATSSEETRGGNGGTNCWNPGEPLIGPDVIVGEIVDLSNYGVDGGIKAYAVGTTSCNIGSSNLLWQDNTPNVPVIGQNFFRLKNGRFEQIGQGWLKYAFTALTQNACGCGCSGQGGSVLGVGCSDPYCCGLNGAQGSLGPKHQINAYTGSHPANQPPFGGGSTITRRLQVAISDIDNMQNGGGLYFAEAQYITPDDAAAGNQFNNASYRQINIAQGTWNASLAGSTQREQPAIRAWQDNDPLVSEAEVRVPNEGLIILASKVTDLGGNMWHYEYAVQNLNSDRSVGTFSMPLDDTAVVTNVGFRDVAYHSGEVQDGTDWAFSRSGNVIRWETVPFSVNQNANALRWGTLYNFRFDSNAPPSRIEITLGLFKPGTPSSVSASADGPFLCVPENCDDGNPCTDDGCGPTACSFTFNSNACNDGNQCTVADICLNGVCAGTPTVIIPGDVHPAGGNQVVDVDDMLCALIAFSDIANCPSADTYPCPPNQDGIIDSDDLAVILGAFSQQYICQVPCPP